MTDQHPEPIHPTLPEGCHGVPHPPMIRTMAAPGEGTVPVGTVIHHWAQGPQDVTRTPARRIQLRDGTTAPTRWRVRWFLDRVTGCSRGEALRALYDVLRHPQGWARAGVALPRTADRNEASLLVRVIPADTTVCGAGAAGCYSWSEDSMPVLEVGVEYVGDPGFAMLVNHEFGHALFAMHDHYPQAGVSGHSGYVGVMGTWEAASRSGYYPPAHEVSWAKKWLAGLADHVHQH